MKVAATTTINNSIDINSIKGVPGIENYKAFISWICGIKFNGKIYKIDDIKKVCEAYKLYETFIGKNIKPKPSNNKIEAINCYTNKRIVFENRKAAAEHFKYKTPDTITTYICTNTKVKKCWQLRYTE